MSRLNVIKEAAERGKATATEATNPDRIEVINGVGIGIEDGGSVFAPTEQDIDEELDHLTAHSADAYINSNED